MRDYATFALVLRDHERHKKMAIARARVIFSVSTLLVVCVCAGGCRKQEPDFEIMTLDRAKVEQVKANADGTGEITVIYYSEKHGQDVSGEGLITKDTEIMINGAVAGVAELRQGDRVSGSVRIEGKGKKKKQFALKIKVERPKPVGG